MAAGTATDYDVLIRGGRIVDGTGNPWFHGDLAIRGDRIAAIAPPGTLPAERATEVVDAAGHVVSPGFVDIQSHSPMPFLTDRRSLSKVTQGVTTEIMGEMWTPSPFGGRIAHPFGAPNLRLPADKAAEWDARARTWTRFGDWLADLEQRRVSVNFGSFIGGGTVREYGRGMDMGPSSPEEMAAMRGVVDEAMRDGAFGVATALIYPPGAFADQDELTALMEVVAAFDGIHITHVRSEGAQLVEGIGEAIAIARQTGVRTEIYHLKAVGRRNWPLMEQVIADITAARADGIDIAADMYPYEASGTGLATCLPHWASEGGRLYQNLSDSATRERIRDDMTRETPNSPASSGRNDPDIIMVIGMTDPEITRYRGWRIRDIAADRDQDWRDTILDLLTIEGRNIPTLFFGISEDNIRRQLREPWIKISTDAGGIDPTTATGAQVHPRAYGTYPKVLAKYVREEGVIPLEDAVRKMSSAVCDRLGLRDRGLLRAGMQADVIIFDPATIQDHATWTDSHQLSTGVRDVWVNGGRVLKNASHTDAAPGVWVKGPGSQ